MNDTDLEQERLAPPTQDPFPWNLWTRRVMTVILLVGAVYSLSIIGNLVHIIIVPAILAYILFTPIRFLVTHTHLSYSVAAGIVFIITLIVGGIIVINLAAEIISFIAQLAADLQVLLEQASQFLISYTPDQGIITNSSGQQVVNLNPILEPLSTLFKEQNVYVGEITSSLLAFIGSIAASITSLLGNSFLIILLTAVFIFEFPNYYRWMINLTPHPARSQYKIMLQRSEKMWASFFRGSLIVAGIQGALTAAQFMIMGIPNALLIGLITAFLFIIPIIGGFIALVPMALVPLFQGSTVLDLGPLELTLAVIGVNLIIQLIVWNIIEPIVKVGALKLPVVLYLLGVMVGTALAGPIGAFLSLPLLAVGREVITFVIKKIQLLDPYPGTVSPVFRVDSMFGLDTPPPIVHPQLQPESEVIITDRVKDASAELDERTDHPPAQ